MQWWESERLEVGALCVGRLGGTSFLTAGTCGYDVRELLTVVGTSRVRCDI
jgi:hypothetical protein